MVFDGRRDSEFDCGVYIFDRMGKVFSNKIELRGGGEGGGARK